MNVIKEYKVANKQKGTVTFGSAHGGRWSFRAADKESGVWVKIMKVPGGREIAERIANVIHTSWLRTAGKKKQSADRIDGKARRQMDFLVGLRTLADWKGEPEWWSNDVAEATLAVPMIYPNRRTIFPVLLPVSPEDLGLAPVVEAEPELELVAA